MNKGKVAFASGKGYTSLGKTTDFSFSSGIIKVSQRLGKSSASVGRDTKKKAEILSPYNPHYCLIVPELGIEVQGRS